MAKSLVGIKDYGLKCRAGFRMPDKERNFILEIGDWEISNNFIENSISIWYTL
ncbi:MAG: hypothetical protein K2G45_01475 [Lachnospiraceae bacterium]|nr:hypothetical protein [Lachnospiraceae bacterium]